MLRRKIKFILLSILIAVIIFVLWIIRPPSSYDKSKVDGRLTSLEEPFKSVSAGYYQDGGSVSIEIIDKNGTLLKIALPAFDFDPSYDKVYFGASHYSELKEVVSAEADNPVETKLMIEDILHRYSKGNLSIDLPLAVLRGRVIDYIRILYHNRMGYFKVEPETDDSRPLN